LIGSPSPPPRQTIFAASYDGAMRRPGLTHLPLLAAVTLTACSGIQASTSLQARIDAAGLGGDVDLPAGIWIGEVTIRKPVTLHGAGREVTILSGRRPLSIGVRGVRVEGLTVRGAETAISVEPDASLVLRHARLESAGTGIAIAARASAVIEDTTAVCSAESKGAAAVRVEGQLQATGLDVSGPWRRGIDATSATVTLSGVTMRDAEAASIHAVDSTLHLSDVDLSTTHAGAAGVFAARCHLTGEKLKLSGGEEGFLLRDGDTRIDGLTATRISSSAFAAVGGTESVQHADLTGPFSEAAISALNGSSVSVSDVDVHAGGAVGLLAVNARVEASSMRVDGARCDRDGDFGHGFALEKSTGTFRDIQVTHAEGAAIYASDERSRGQVDGCVASEVAVGAMAVLEANLSLSRCDLKSTSIGALATGHARIVLSGGELHAPVGVMACVGSTIETGGGIVLTAPVPRQSCRDESLEKTWRRGSGAPHK